MDNARFRLKNPLYVIVYALFVLLVIVPVAFTLGKAFFAGGTLFQNLQLLTAGTFLLLAKTCLLAVAVALLAMVVGATLGFLLYKTDLPARGFFRIALLVPLFISPYILAVAWKDLFFMVFHDTAFMTSFAGVVLVLTTIYSPLAMLITGSALSNIDAQLEESGLMIMDSRKVVWKITLPLIKPALISSFVLVFIFSLSEFSVPAFLGVKVFTTEIFTQFSAFYNHSLAILQSSLLILVCVLLLLAEGKYIAEAPFLSVGSKGTMKKSFKIHGKKAILILLLSGWLFVSVILPFIMLALQSLRDGTQKFAQALDLLAPTFANSIMLAAGGALAIVFTGFVTACYAAGKSGKIFDWLLLIVFAIPSTVLGISLIHFYNRPGLDFIYSGYAIILIGYLGKFTFIAGRLAGNAIRQVPASLTEAALIEGISPLRRALKIMIPLIMPALFAAFLISFIFCLGELGTTIMVYPPGTEIMPIKVFTIMANAPQALTSSMTLIVFSITLIIITAFYFMARPFFTRYRYAGH